MAHEKQSRDALVGRFEAYRSFTLPRLVDGLNFDDADVDLYEEDGYLAGLVETFLIDGSLPIERIRLDQSIDNRIDHAEANTNEAAAALRAFQYYRKEMHRLASILARTAGVAFEFDTNQKVA